MSAHTEFSSIRGYASHWRNELAAESSVQVGKLRDAIDMDGFGWLDEYVSNAEKQASGSGSMMGMTEMLKTPSRMQSAKKTRTATATAQNRMDKVTSANSKLFGSPSSKTTNAVRLPLSPLGARSLNVAPQPNAGTSTKAGLSSQNSVKASPARSNKSSASSRSKAAGKKGKVKKGEVAEPIQEIGLEPEVDVVDGMSVPSSAATRLNEVQSSVSSASSTEDRDHPSQASQFSRPIVASLPSQASRPDAQPLQEEVDSERLHPGDSSHLEEMDQDSEPAVSSIASRIPSAKAKDLSVIAEGEEDRTSASILPKEPSNSARSAILAVNPEPVISEPSVVETIPSTSDVAGTQPPAPPAPSGPMRQVRSSWLSKALGGSAVPLSTVPQRTSDGKEVSRKSMVGHAEYPGMRKSLVQPGTLMKRKSGEGVDDEAADHNDTSKRPEKIPRNDQPPSSGSMAQPYTQAAVESSAKSLPVPAPVTQTRPVFDRQSSYETFSRPTSASSVHPVNPAQPPQPSTLPLALFSPTEDPSSDFSRVSKALDGLRERQAAKEVAKQKATLASSGPAPAAARAKSTGAGFLRGLGNSLGRSLGIGGGTARDAEEEARRLKKELEDEEEAERKAREDLSEILKHVSEENEGSAVIQAATKAAQDGKEKVQQVEGRKSAASVAKVAPQQEMDELDEDDEEEVNRSIELEEAPEEVESPIVTRLRSPRSPTVPKQTAKSPLRPKSPTPAKQTRPQSPVRNVRPPHMSTTPQNSPPQHRLEKVMPSIQSRVEQMQPAPSASVAPPADTKVSTKTQQVVREVVPKNSVQDRVRAFETAPLAPVAVPAPVKPPPVLSPTKSGVRRSQAIDIDDDNSPTVPIGQPSVPKQQAAIARQTVEVDPAPQQDTVEEMEEVVETDESRPPTAQAHRLPKSTSSVSLAASTSSQGTSILSHGNMVANKALGIKPSIGPIRSLQQANAASKKDLAASERRAQIAEQKKADKAEDERKQRQAELDEKRRLRAEMEARRKANEERKILIANQKAEKEKIAREKEREAAEQAKAEEEARRRKAAAASANRPTTVAPLQNAKRVISASASSTSIAMGVSKAAETAKVNRPTAVPGAVPMVKMGPNAFRTAPPETPAAQISQTIRLVSQTSTAVVQQPVQQAERKPLGPPTRPSAHAASSMAAALRQSVAATTSAHATQSATLLAQQRLNLVTQLDAHAQEGAPEDIELPDINSEYSQSDDSDDESPNFKRPAWAESPELRAALAAQARKDPDELFGPIQPIRMEELFKGKNAKNIFRARTSSGNWQRDGLTREEEITYARRMGFSSNLHL